MKLQNIKRYAAYKDIPFDVPHSNEQRLIANYLDDKTVQIDSIIATINAQTDKLKELRKTLINDVVTGKIKVVPEGGAA